MSRERKTVDVQELKRRVNHALDWEGTALPDSIINTPEYRAGQASVLEQALLMANAYHGFRYTDKAGGKRTPEGYLVPGTYDDTRRHYY